MKHYVFPDKNDTVKEGDELFHPETEKWTPAGFPFIGMPVGTIVSARRPVSNADPVNPDELLSRIRELSKNMCKLLGIKYDE